MGKCNFTCAVYKISHWTSKIFLLLALQARPLLSGAMNEGDFDGLVDPRLHQKYNANEMRRMVACASACVRHSAWLRPRMSQVTMNISLLLLTK